ncbi:hypothetical protein PWM22_01785 [Lactobacillus gasseri]|nr:hypothetical protein [Lactobacillus gasseri]MDE1534134.1 hypothetical protein [Lactobacillus gasseri]
MMRQINKRNIMTGLGAAALLASLSLNGTAFAATTDSANAVLSKPRLIRLSLSNIKTYKLILILYQSKL